MDLQIDLEDFIKDNSKEIDRDNSFYIQRTLSRSLYGQDFISDPYTQELELVIKRHILTHLNGIISKFKLKESKIWLDNSTFEIIVIKKHHLLQNRITIIKLIKKG